MIPCPTHQPILSHDNSSTAEVGDALLNRIGGQNSIYRNTYPFGSPFTSWAGVDVANLLPRTELPNGFDYPRDFVRVVELGLTNLERGGSSKGDQLRDRFLGLRLLAALRRAADTLG